MTCVTSYKKKKKQYILKQMTSISEKLSKFIALQCNKLNQIKLVGKTNDKYVITFGIARTERSLSIDDSSIFDFFFVFWVDKCTLVIRCSF
jgi:hypothetical protein